MSRLPSARNESPGAFEAVDMSDETPKASQQPPTMKNMNINTRRVHYGFDPDQPAEGIEEIANFDIDAQVDAFVASIMRDVFDNAPPSPPQKALIPSFLSGNPPSAGPLLPDPLSSSVGMRAQNQHLRSYENSFPPLPVGHMGGARGPRRHRSKPYTEAGEWSKVETRLKRSRLGRVGEHVKGDPAFAIVPETFEQYKEHKRWYGRMRSEALESRKRENTRMALQLRKYNINAIEARHLPAVPDGRAPVLGPPTIWTPIIHGLNPHRLVSDWPTVPELKEDGDERHTSQFGRALPMPRDPANQTLSWKYRPLMDQTDFDWVSPVPLPPKSLFMLKRDENGHIIDDPAQFGRTAYVVQTTSNPVKPKFHDQPELRERSGPHFRSDPRIQPDLRFQPGPRFQPNFHPQPHFRAQSEHRVPSPVAENKGNGRGGRGRGRKGSKGKVKGKGKSQELDRGSPVFTIVHRSDEEVPRPCSVGFGEGTQLEAPGALAKLTAALEKERCRRAIAEQKEGLQTRPFLYNPNVRNFVPADTRRPLSRSWRVPAHNGDDSGSSASTVRPGKEGSRAAFQR